MRNVRRSPRTPSIVVLLLAATASSSAQGGGEAVTPPAQHQHHAESDRVGLFPPRESSGTSWQPDATPMHGMHRRWIGWDVMLHGNAFGQVLYEPGERHRTGGFASRQLSSVNWGMVMARRSLAAGRVGLRAMVSVEPWTVSDCGYLNFLATGEICDGDTIHDRQHPHDLFMELAGEYDRPVGGSLRWQVYAGLAGEPALGPGGFPHRASAMLNPVAPISHHWLDSTHISFGLITTGLYDRRWKAEMSLFNGREPDANRADLDLAPLDSVSGRVTVLATDRLALQVSAAHLREAESGFPPQPRRDVNRATASATYHIAIGEHGAWATTLAYGANSGREVLPDAVVEATTHAVLAESSVTLADRHSWFGRAEVVGKPAHDLHAHEYGASIFTVGKLQVGYVRHLSSWRGLTPSLGGTVSTSVLPPELGPRYSGRVAPGIGVFFSIRPSRHVM